MRVRAVSLSMMLSGASACAEQPGPPARADAPPPDAELVADEVSGANAETDGALRLSRLVLGNVGAAEAASQQAAVDKVTSGTGDGPGDIERAECIGPPERDAADAGAVLVRFDDCRGPFGTHEISGTLRFAFSKALGVPGLRVQVGIAPGTALTVQGARVSEYGIDATLSFPAAGTAAMAWRVVWAREARGGRDLRLRADFRTVLERQPPVLGGPRECFTTAGRASFEAGERGFAFDVEGYRLCPRPLVPVCPESGAWTVTDAASSQTVAFRFTGEAAPEGPGGEARTFLEVNDASGRERRVAVRCGVRAGG